QGSSDGTGTSAKFKYPNGISSDGTNLYVADPSNQSIRKIVISTGAVTTLAGSAGSAGSTDGTGTSAKFNWPEGITTDGTNLYVAERGGHKIRKIDLSKIETTDVALRNIDDDFPTNPEVTVKGMLTNKGNFELKDGDLILSGGAMLDAGSLDVTGSTLNLGNNLTKTGGSMVSATSILKLSDNVSISSNNELTFKDVNLNRFALSLGSATSFLKISNQVAINNAADQINTGTGTVKFSGGLTIGAGKVSANGGRISLLNASTISADGVLDVSSGVLELNAALNVSGSGTLKTNSSTSFTLNNNALNLSGGNAASGGVLETDGYVSLDGMTFDEKSTIKFNANTTLSSSNPVTVKTVDMGAYSMGLANATTDLTISGNLTINPSGNPYQGGISTGAADLTFNGVLNVQKGYISSSGGKITFGAGSNGSSFAGNHENSGMQLTDTSLVLQTDLAVPYLVLSGSSLLQSNNKKLTPGLLRIGMDSELDFTDIVTNANTILRLAGNSGIKKTGALVLKQIDIVGHTLTLNPNITGLTAEGIYLTNYDNSSNSYLTNDGKLLASGVDINMTKRLWIDRGKIEMGGGTLSLVQGGGLDSNGNGELDLTNSTLSLSGPFVNDGGKLTTSASTLILNANTFLRLGNAAVFETYTPNGWGLLTYNNSSNTNTSTSLTLGKAGGSITLKPNTNALTSKFVSWYHDNSTVEYMQFQTRSGPTTIPPVGIGIDTADTSLTINGDLNLKDNATIFSNSGEVSLGELDIESGRVIVVGNTKLNLAGGKVGVGGEIKAPTTGPATVKLLGDLEVKGIFGVAASVTLDLSGKTIDASGGELDLGGTRTLDKITTDNDTTLKVLGSLNLSRADSGTSKVGDLQFLQL
ncbi:hypothetical protein OAK48_04845, partial [Deltaproteobacteria bacterium]|nr:hypothetical protein [Deltaproteobacteria bacterium]